VQTDPTVARFSTESRRQQPTAEQLAEARVRYQQRLFSECFDFGSLRFRLNRLLALVVQNDQVLRVAGLSDPKAMLARAEGEIFTVGENFKRQLANLFAAGGLTETDATLRERACKASAYFEDKLTDILGSLLEELSVESDNKELLKRTKDADKWLREELAVKFAAVRSSSKGFTPDRYLRAISKAQVEEAAATRKPKEGPQYLESDIQHAELFEALRKWRAERAVEEEVPHYRILHQKILIQLAVTLPASLAALKEIKGIGGRTAEKYGDELLALVTAYRKRHGISGVALPAPETDPLPAKGSTSGNKPRAAGNTRQITFDLLQSGLSIDEIAQQRGLATSTIETHLEEFVASGKVAIDRLLAADKQHTIRAQVKAMGNCPLGEYKRSLGDDCSYGEIRLVLAHLRAQGD
jgi:hypothetical protein